MRSACAAFVGVALALAACAAGRRPDFTLDFRASQRGVLMRDMWYGLLTHRYGCDTVMVKARGGRTLGPGATACQAAQWIDVPTVIRSWRDSTVLTEQWDYRQGACTLVLEGWSPTFLFVRTSRC